MAAVWGFLWLVLFRDVPAPLSLALPPLLCAWTRRRWQLWTLAVALAAIATLKTFSAAPAEMIFAAKAWQVLAGRWFNILVSSLAVQAIMIYRDRAEEHTITISERNDEIRSQAEELMQQNEEIETQASELEGQNDRLHDTNKRLRSREEILSILLQSSRALEFGTDALIEVCRSALRIIGDPATTIAIFELEDKTLVLRAHAAADGQAPPPREWPLESSIGQVVLQTDKTAYVPDLRLQPDLAAPFRSVKGINSLLATPLRIAGNPGGIIVACGEQAGHWNDEHFRVIEWLAAQCALITEGIRQQRELAQHTKRLEAASKAKDQFIAMLSHELRTPLTPVLAAVSVLGADDRLPADVRADIEMIRRNISVQRRLIDDLLDLTRITRGMLGLEKEDLDIAALLREAAAVVAPERKAKQQALATNLEKLGGSIVHGDSARLQQVFWNLLKNAINFSPPNSQIVVLGELTADEPSRARIEIVDNGIGIDPGDLERIFLPFEQVAAHGKHRGAAAGLGLGLGIAKAIVELHRGSIRVFSEGINRGARFTVELPLAGRPGATPAPATPESPARRQAAATAETPLHILLVEDHADTGRAMSRLLTRAGHTVEFAENAANAMALFQLRHFDLLISDLGLPDESGLDLMRKLRYQRPGLVGICLSGYGTEDDLRDCREAGFTEHITKPVDMSRLRAAIARATSKVERIRGA